MRRQDPRGDSWYIVKNGMTLGREKFLDLAVIFCLATEADGVTDDINGFLQQGLDHAAVISRESCRETYSEWNKEEEDDACKNRP